MNIDDLSAYGANVDEGLGRCMGNEQLFLRLVDTIRTDGAFDDLQRAIESGKLGEAFEVAHGLKGSLGNLALTPLYVPMCDITELLRAGSAEGCPELLGVIMAERDKLRAL